MSVEQLQKLLDNGKLTEEQRALIKKLIEDQRDLYNDLLSRL